MSNDPFDFRNATGIGGGDLVKYFKAGQGFVRMSAGWGLKRRLQKEGYDAITVDAAVEAVKNGRDPEPILLQARNAYAIRERQGEMRRNPPPVHGAASWASERDLERVGLLSGNSGSGISLGRFNGRPVTWDGEGHLMTVAPTRTGKSTMQIIPNLLTYKGAAVVLDPKGELYAATGKWREENVGPVYALNPFGLPPLGSFSDSFNPLLSVTDGDSATSLAEVIFPRSGDQRQAFFDNEAITLLAAVIQYVACHKPKAERHLSTVRNHLASVNRQLFELMREMTQPHLPDAITNPANNFLTKSKEHGKPRVVDSINQHLRIWDSEGLRNATCRADFDFRDLKERPITVYLMIPFAGISAYSTFVRMVFATALNAMLENRAKPDIPVLFVLDEFLALDADERFVSALRTHASERVRLWFFLQDLPTLEQKYPTTWKSFLQVETKTFFGTDDPFTAQLISNYLGDRTVAYDIPNMSASTSGGSSGSASYSISENLHLAGRNLMTPDEVMTFMAGDNDSRNAIHFMRNIRQTTTQLTPFFADAVLKGRAT
ncbi:type IV secretory system conjugative DNA transfer family protein [Salaquimonas pukyongi]|uniref:type IV secretory system conjugative DNA transfer family protein n=1 Tax=Salaquimonas pukyongi TaxID=2712698 RepID=UPI00096BCBFD|nr:type IV secretory system conjugative DNA transfer family protein [Salaquimonas pukyongi]